VSVGQATTVHTSGARSFLRRHAYSVLAAIIAVAMIGHTVNQTWAAPDFWFHLASVRVFAHSPFDPGNPLVVGNAADPYMSPYAFVLGVITRVTGASPVTVLATAGLFNLVLLFIGIRRFAECVSPAELVPVFTLLFTLLAWGLNPWRWSGFFELNSIGTVLPLSSTFASGLGLVTIAALCAWLRGRGAAHLIVAGVGAPLVLLCHPITAVWVGALGIGFLISEANPQNRRRVPALVAVIAGATLLAVAWPFYPVFGALVRSRSFDASNAAMYHRVAQRTFLALPGFVLLVVRFVQRRKDPLAIGAALMAAVFVFGYVFHHGALGRVLPGLLLTAHVAMAVWLADVVTRWADVSARSRYLISGTVAVILLVGLAGSAAGVIRDVPRAVLPARFKNDQRLESLVAPFTPLTRLVPIEDVIVASPPVALAVAASSGKVIAPPGPAPFVDDIAKRNRALKAALSSRTSPRAFRQLNCSYHVKWYVLLPRDARRLQSRVRSGDLRPERTLGDLSIFRVAPASCGA
jgi:hypothetical protein